MWLSGCSSRNRRNPLTTVNHCRCRQDIAVAIIVIVVQPLPIMYSLDPPTSLRYTVVAVSIIIHAPSARISAGMLDSCWLCASPIRRRRSPGRGTQYRSAYRLYVRHCSMSRSSRRLGSAQQQWNWIAAPPIPTSVDGVVVGHWSVGAKHQYVPSVPLNIVPLRQLRR